MKREYGTNENKRNKRIWFWGFGNMCWRRGGGNHQHLKPKTKNLLRLFHLISFVSFSLFILLTAVSCDSNKNTARPSITTKPVSTPTSGKSKRLIKKEGWKVPGLAVAKVIFPPRVLPAASNEQAKVYSSWLRPYTGNADPVTLRNFLSEEERNKLGITAFKLPVTTIIKYDLGDRPFCYVVKYHATYTMEGLHYYDEDGDNRFELVETGTASTEFIPRIPGWMQH